MLRRRRVSRLCWNEYRAVELQQGEEVHAPRSLPRSPTRRHPSEAVHRPVGGVSRLSQNEVVFCEGVIEGRILTGVSKRQKGRAGNLYATCVRCVEKRCLPLLWQADEDEKERPTMVQERESCSGVSVQSMCLSQFNSLGVVSTRQFEQKW